MPYCPSCGREIPWGIYCPYCGKPTGSDRVTPGVEQQPATWQQVAPRYIYPPPPAAYPTYAAPAAGPRSRQVVPVGPLRAWALVGALSMCALIVVSFLPWARYSGIGISGWRHDGKIVFVLGLLGIACTVAAVLLKSRWPFIGLITLGVISGWIIIIDILDVIRTATLSFSNVGVGLLIGAAACLVAVVAGAAGTSLRPSPAPAEQSPSP